MGGQFTKPAVVRGENPIEEGKEMGSTWVHHSPRSSTGIAYWLPGGGMKPHYHESHDEIMTVVEGSVAFRLGDEIRAMGPGEVVSVPAGIIHAPIHTEGGCLVVSVFAPWFDPENPDRIFIDD
jgi:mannose-6-phosphate isomerase-like protein (cupin superfamily)